MNVSIITGASSAASEGFVLNLASKMFSHQSMIYAPTRIHWEIIATMCAHPGWLYSRTQLLDAVGMSFSQERSIDSHIKRIRAQFRTRGWPVDLIGARHSLGYHWNADYPVTIVTG